MYDPKAEVICKMLTDLVNKHQGQIYSCVWDWHILKIEHPQYKSKIEQPVPYLDIQFK
jgi:hypothetical protein